MVDQGSLPAPTEAERMNEEQIFFSRGSQGCMAVHRQIPRPLNGEIEPDSTGEPSDTWLWDGRKTYGG